MTGKNWQMLLVAGALCLAMASSAGAGVVQNGLVSWWKFDETGDTTTAADSKGINNGTLNGNLTWTTDTPGVASSGALSFGGLSADYIEVANAASLNISTAITMEAWVKVLGGDMNTILNKGSSYTEGYDFSVKHQDGWNDYGYINLKDVNGDYFSGVPFEEWVHLAYTYDSADTSNKIRFYINGVFAGDLTGSGTIGTNVDHLIIGNQGNLDAAWAFNGMLDDVRIYDRALTEAEVGQNYAAIVPEPATMGLLLLGIPLALRRRKRQG